MRGNHNAQTLEDHDRLKREIGQRLRNVRIERNISLKKMSVAMDLSYQAVWKYEEGISDIPITRLLKYCQIARISSDNIFAGLVSAVVAENVEYSVNISPKDVRHPSRKLSHSQNDPGAIGTNNKNIVENGITLKTVAEPE